MKNKNLISAVSLFVLCVGMLVLLLYARTLFFNHPSSEGYLERDGDVSADQVIAQEPVWELVEQGKQYELYYAKNTFEYSYKIYDKKGTLTYNSQNSNVHLKSVEIKNISDHIMKIHWGAGTYVNLEVYYDRENDRLSQWFQNPYMEFDDYVVHYDGTYLIVQNMFGRDLDYRIFPCDFTTTASPSHIELSDDKTKLTIMHLKPDGLTEVRQTFEIKVNSSHVSSIDKNKKYDDWNYVNARLPSVRGIGNKTQTKKINDQYLKLYNDAISEAKDSYEHPALDASAPDFRPSANARTFDYDFSVVAETKDYVSIKMHESWYGGGMHPLHFIWVDNYDLKTGQVLILEDFLGNIPDWQEKLENELRRLNEVRKHKKGDNLPTWSVESMIKGKDNMFFVENGNLHILYNEYELGPYSDGWVELALPIHSLISQ